jgi:WS/DGAT/MGAT family acyltransferase
MKQLRQLTSRETFFIGGETACVYQHTGGLILLDARESPGFGFEAFREALQERIGKVPQFRWRLHEVPLGLDLPYWVEDEHFSFDRHIRRIAVPSPGDRAALGELASYLYSRHLDRGRPLWETWFIEGLPKGQFAMLQKMHHCIIDGEGAARLGDVMNDLEPDAAPRPVDPAISSARPGRVPNVWEQSSNLARRYSRLPFEAGRGIFDAVVPGVRRRLLRDDSTAKKPPAPLAYFNTEIGEQRAFVFGSLPLADIKAIKDHFGVTFNDVVLAVVGGSLRAYLLPRGELPTESLRTSMPVSLRTAEDDEFTNRVTATTVTLATALADPVQRLKAIAEESDRAKAEAHAGAMGFMEVMQILPPILVNAMMNLTPAETAVQTVGTNLLVSSVRGSPRPMYMAGARQSAMYPISIITPGQPINVTCLSYAGQVDVGITLEPNLFPDPWDLLDGLHTALGEYRTLAGKKPRRTRKAAGAGRGGARGRRPGRKRA